MDVDIVFFIMSKIQISINYDNLKTILYPYRTNCTSKIYFKHSKLLYKCTSKKNKIFICTEKSKKIILYLSIFETFP